MTPNAAAVAKVSSEQAPVPAALLQIRDLIYQTAGIFYANHKIRLLEVRCVKRMTALGVGSLREYHACLTSTAMRHAELISLLNEITVGETYFFRNRQQLEAIRNVVLPHIVEAKMKHHVRQIKIWSAGCSTGEEPYTFAIALLEEANRRLKGWQLEVLATDLNERSIAFAQVGEYGEYSVRHMEDAFLKKYFIAGKEKFVIRPAVKSMVSFKRLNLFDDAQMAEIKGIDIVVCSNVLIYFDAVSKRRVIGHFHNSLFNQGYLFLGQAESLFGINDQFALVHLPSATAYMKSRRHLTQQAG